MENINLVSIVLEGVVVLIALMIAIGKRRGYGWGLALTFLIYVFYDLTRTQGWEFGSQIMELSFLVATVSAVAAVISIYRKS